MNEKTKAAIHLAARLSLPAVACLVLLSCPVSAGDPLHKILGCPVPDCIGKWCADDYCAKQEPCVRVPLCFGCNDYCCKREPSVCAPLRFCCDDYCKKNPPTTCRVASRQFSQCGVSCRQSGCEQRPCDTCVTDSRKSKQQAIVEGEDSRSDDLPSEQPHALPPVFVRALDIQITR